MGDRPETTRFYRKRLPHWEVADGRYFVTIRLKGAIPQAGIERIRQLRAQLETAVQNGQSALDEQRAIFREMEHWLDCADKVDTLTQPKVAEMIKEAIDYREERGIWQMFAYTLMPNHLHLFFRLGPQSRYIELSRVDVLASSDHRRSSGMKRASISSDRLNSAHLLQKSAPTLTSSAHLPQKSAPTLTSSAHLPQKSAPTLTSSAHLLRGNEIDRYGRSALETALHDFKNYTGRKANRILGYNGQFWQREWFDHWSRSTEEDAGIERYICANPVKAGLVRQEDDWPYTKRAYKPKI